jgi:hypothetical protein
MDTDLKKLKKEGFLAESVEVIFPSTKVIPAPPSGFWGDVSSFPPLRFLSPGP